MSAVETRADTAGCAEQETARLFEAHSAHLLAYCRRHLRSGADAEDALQTTFLYALRALRRGVEPECEAAWLTAIAKNVCFTQLRTVGRRGPVAADVELDRIALAEPEPDEAELVAALPGALAALPENQRNAIVMREWLGLGAGEIAERLELTPTATSALLTRARRSLASALTTAGRPRSALNLGLLLDLVRTQLRALLGGAGSKAAVGVVVASVAVGGVVVERSVAPSAPRHPGGRQQRTRAREARAARRLLSPQPRPSPEVTRPAGTPRPCPPLRRPPLRLPRRRKTTARPAAARDAQTSTPRADPASRPSYARRVRRGAAAEPAAGRREDGRARAAGSADAAGRRALGATGDRGPRAPGAARARRAGRRTQQAPPLPTLP